MSIVGAGFFKSSVSHAAVSALALCLVSAPAAAQDQVQDEEETQDDNIENVIVVTAQKREQNIAEVPASITAVSGEELVARDVTDFTDIAKVAPSVRITGSGANGNIQIRGIGTQVFSTSAESAVLTIVDDLAVLQSGQAFDALSDVQRIEVLRGPQGTLFGKGASAGVINIVTRGPTDRFEANFSTQLVDDGRFNLQAGAGGALTDGVGLRVAGYYNDNEGLVRNKVTGTMLGSLEGFGFRTKLRLDPLHNLRVDLNYSHAETSETVASGTYNFLPPNTVLPFNVVVNNYLNGVQPGPRNREVAQNIDSTRDSNTDVASVNVDLDLGFASLVSITGWQDWRNTTLNDFDTTAAPVFGSPTGIVQGGPYVAKLFSQELRLVSSDAEPLKYLIGAYYADGSTDRAFTRTLGTPLQSNWESNAGTVTKAVFAEASYMLPTRTEVTAGVRYNNEKISVEFLNLIPSNNPPANNRTCLSLCSGSSSDDVVTYKLAVRQEITPDVSAYASYATGYKGGAYDIVSGFTPTKARNPANPETSKAYELGFRGSVLDGRALVSLIGFLTDYDDFQRQAVVVPENPADPPEFRLTNVGALRTKGIELEVRTNPFRNLQLNGYLAYIDATIRRFPNAPCYQGQTVAQGCTDPDGPGGADPFQDLAGARLNGVSKWSYNIFARQDFDTPGVPFDPYIQADWRYQSNIQNDLAQNPNSITEARTRLDLAVGARFRSENIILTFFVNNALDKFYDSTGGAPTFHPATVITNNVSREQGRTFGVRLTGSF